jgi:hypothetical protein
MPVAIESLANAAQLEQWRREKGMLAFGLHGAQAQATVLDVLIAPVIPYADLRRDACMIDVVPYRIPVASIDHLIREIEANREFLLMAYRQNPALLARAEPRIRELFKPAAPAQPAPAQS